MKKYFSEEERTVLIAILLAEHNMNPEIKPSACAAIKKGAITPHLLKKVIDAVSVYSVEQITSGKNKNIDMETMFIFKLMTLQKEAEGEL